MQIRPLYQTLTEKSYFWLTGLCEFSQMESNLINLANCLETDVKRTLTQRHSEIGAASSGNTTSWISKLIIGLRNAAEESCRIQTTIICIGGSDGRWFQAKYIQIRSLLLASLSNLCSNVYRALKIERWSGSILMNQPFKSDPIQNEATDFTTYSRDSSSSSQSLVWDDVGENGFESRVQLAENQVFKLMGHIPTPERRY
ncbi:unnamed protein product [Trichobilharzia regenti]|nr:unnamed protein product [Trichobilharzia regenti]